MYNDYSCISLLFDERVKLHWQTLNDSQRTFVGRNIYYGCFTIPLQYAKGGLTSQSDD